MTLLKLLHRAPTHSQPKVYVAHFNHGLRESQSDLDQCLVETVSRKLGFPFKTHRVFPKGVPETWGPSADSNERFSEETARNLRYQWLEETANSLSCTAIMTAHHANDQAETVVHNLLRGTGLRGLSGMKLARPMKSGTRLLRPLLAFPRQQLLDFAAHNGIEYRNDLSNNDTRFTRNKIRHILMPQLEHLEPDKSESSFENTAKSGDPSETTCMELLTELADSCLETVGVLDEVSRRISESSVVTQTQQHVLLRVSPLGGLPEFLRSHFFAWLWIQQSWPRQKMTSRHWTRVSRLAGSASPQRFQLPGVIEATREGQYVRLKRLAAF